MEPVVTVRHLDHAFGKGDLRKPVLDDVNLDIYPGEIVIMREPSGSGKNLSIGDRIAKSEAILAAVGLESRMNYYFCGSLA